MLMPYRELCESNQVQTENNVLEDVNVVDAILRYISKSGISKLVQQFEKRWTQGGQMGFISEL
jgi:hypothetical protein